MSRWQTHEGHAPRRRSREHPVQYAFAEGDPGAITTGGASRKFLIVLGVLALLALPGIWTLGSVGDVVGQVFGFMTR